MPVVTNHDWLDRIERSRLYMIFDPMFNWIGGIGTILLIAYGFWAYWASEPKPSRVFWLKIGAAGLILISADGPKDLLMARIGLAPPDYSLWFGPRQHAVDEGMMTIIESQNRGTRITARG
jgi:hypothetical protein